LAVTAQVGQREYDGIRVIQWRLSERVSTYVGSMSTCIRLMGFTQQTMKLSRFSYPLRRGPDLTQAERVRQLWQNPEYREKTTNGIRESWRDPQRRRVVARRREARMKRKIATTNLRMRELKSEWEKYFCKNAEWQKLRQRILTRDGGVCRLCPSTHRVSIHHINYDKGDDREENLITLCINHHMRTNFNREWWEQRLHQLNILFCATLWSEDHRNFLNFSWKNDSQIKNSLDLVNYLFSIVYMTDFDLFFKKT